jgi:hypothetical protein
MAETSRPVCDVRIASKGPRFFRNEDGGVMFEIQLDSRSKIGPRPAIDVDRHQYPTAWRAFTTGNHQAAGDAAKAERQRRKDAGRAGGL